MSIALTGVLGRAALGALELGAVEASQAFVPHRKRIRSALSANKARSVLSANKVRSEVNDG